MRLPVLLCSLAALAAPPAAAQASWAEPVSSAWPLADFAFQVAPDSVVTLLAYPSPITAQADTADTYLTLAIDPGAARAWLPRARRFVDSVLTSPRDINDAAVGISFATDRGTGKITLAHQPNARPHSRFLLLLAPPAPGHGWAAQGGEGEARRLLAALEEALALPAPAPGAHDPQISDCDGAALPQVTRHPRITFPTRSRLGARVVLQFVVDSAGVPDTSTVRVLLSSGPEYLRQLRRDLPDLRYQPGSCDGHPVAVTVQQGFSWMRRGRR